MKILFILLVALFVTFAANSQIVNIPDENFKAAVMTHDPVIDINGDGELQVSEASSYSGALNLSMLEISDLTGIEAFTAVTELNCDFNELTSLDISNNSNLEELSCSSNSLEALNVSLNTALVKLVCGSNSLTELDVSNNPDLESLACGGNPIQLLDLRNNSALISFSCSYSNLNSLDLRNGSNENMQMILINNNPDLSCVSVDNADYATANWMGVDSHTTFRNSCSVDISEFDKQCVVEVYPNPFSDRISIGFEELSTYHIRMFDVFGRMVHSESFTGTECIVSTSYLVKGTYVLQVQSGKRLWKEVICRDK